MRTWRWPLLALALILMVVGLRPVFHPGSRSQRGADLPWQITQGADSIVVFDLALGRSTLRMAIDKLGPRHELALFEDPAQALSLEAYFRGVFIGGLNARMVLTLAPSTEVLQTLQRQATAGQPTPSGSRRYDIPEPYPVAALEAPIETITYVPLVNIEPTLLERHLGPPETTLEQTGERLHWLYPSLGLAVSWEAEQSVFQYIKPAQFTALQTRLSQIPQPPSTDQDTSTDDRS